MSRSQALPNRSDFTAPQNRALLAALRELRDDRGIKQVGLARLLGVSQQAVSKLLKGDAGFAYKTASRLSAALGFGGVDAFFASRRIKSPAARATVTELGVRSRAPTGTDD